MKVPSKHATARSILALCVLLLGGCAAEKKDLRSATALWTEHCASCHGEDGKGDPRSIELYPKLDLTVSPMIAQRERFLIHDRIARGYGTMPGFLHRLQAEEIGRLVNRCLELAAPKEGNR
jgi:mono/diheme cytochrome c family protein